MGNIDPSKYLIFVFAAFCFSFIINKLFLSFSRNLGGRSKNENIVRWSSVTKPAFGGISFFIVFLLSYSTFPIFFSDFSLIGDIQVLGILSAGVIAFLMGLADDAYDTNPSLKFIVQFAGSIILILTGTYIQLFESIYFNYIITILWVVGMMNSINMLDNMDGVSTIASISAFLGMLLVSNGSIESNSMFIMMASGMIAALFGFLYFNWNPSKMYMGDTGSQFLGILLGGLTIHFLWNPIEIESEIAISKQFLYVILAFLVPLSDTTTVVINRLAKGQSPFIGGKDHTTHHLSYLGLSDRMVAVTVAILSAISLIIIYFMTKVDQWSTLLTIIITTYAFIVFLSLFLITKRTHKKRA